MKETIVFEDCDNGVFLKIFPTDPDAVPSYLVYQNENKTEEIGKLLLENIKHCMESKSCNIVEITIKIEPIKGV